tara:strand:+ start:741 stop:1046 length:306 start_codon:yes stop_codon:yes gene_type:complete
LLIQFLQLFLYSNQVNDNTSYLVFISHLIEHTSDKKIFLIIMKSPFFYKEIQPCLQHFAQINYKIFQGRKLAVQSLSIVVFGHKKTGIKPVFAFENEILTF